MFTAFKGRRPLWEDVGAVLLATAYFGGFLLAIQVALDKLL
ncbi:hypothetical protein [Paracraurococcus ruber]|nr:hypothetical protein [Paracraurococcus ruber]